MYVSFLTEDKKPDPYGGGTIRAGSINVTLTLFLVLNSAYIFIGPESQRLVCVLSSGTFRFMRDQTEEGSKGEENPLRAYNRAISAGTLASSTHSVGG